MTSNKELNQIVTELFIKGKTEIFLLFLSRNLISQYLKMLDRFVHFLLMKIPNKR